MTSVDLNSDMGEAFGHWRMGDDGALLSIVTSANVACGFHAGDPDVMAETMRRAVESDVGIGAHPGFHDLRGFGRHRVAVPRDTLANDIRYQVGAAKAIAASVGGRVRHLKLHGALSNMACEDAELARDCFAAALDVDPDIIVMGLAGTVMETVARELGCRWAGEIFADRAYEPDGRLVDRRKPGAMIDDPEEAGERVVQMVRDGAILVQDGPDIETRIDTICVHGDGPGAVEMARTVRNSLSNAGIELRRFEGTPL